MSGSPAPEEVMGTETRAPATSATPASPAVSVSSSSAAGWMGGPVLVVGPLPPPHHGVATALQQVLAAGEHQQIPMVLLDTADRRGLANIGVLDFRNVYLALRHGVQFLWLLARHRPAVVSVYISQGRLAFLRDFLFLAPARLTGRGLVVQLQGGYFRTLYDESPWWFRALIRWSLAGADRVTVLGERLRGIFDGLVPPERLRVLPNAIDASPYDRLRERLSARAGAADRAERPTVLYLASITEEKGALDLLRAVPEVHRRVPEARFVICGEVSTPADEVVLRELLAALPPECDVELPGVVTAEAKLRRFMEADVFVFPTRYPPEGHPFVVLEAMAAGLPVVTTDQGAIAETVLDGETGLLVPQGDVAAIAEATARLLEDPERLRRMGDASGRRVRERHDIEDWERALAAIFQEANRGD